MARMTVVVNSILPCQEAFLVDAPTPNTSPHRWIQAESLVVHVRTRHRPVCWGCGKLVWSKGAAAVRLVDLPVFGRPVRLVWHKHRWRCPAVGCATGSFTETNEVIAPARSALTTRAARWATAAVGRDGRAVSDVAAELGCDWHTVNKAVRCF